MVNIPSHTKLPFGLLELDTKGEVIRYSPASEGRSGVQAEDVLGRQFFTEVVPNQQVADFRPRFQLFMSHGKTIDRFSTTFDSEDGIIKIQFLLARITKSKRREEHLALVRIMPE